jgi:hypothetical protein
LPRGPLKKRTTVRSRTHRASNPHWGRHCSLSLDIGTEFRHHSCSNKRLRSGKGEHEVRSPTSPRTLIRLCVLSVWTAIGLTQSAGAEPPSAEAEVRLAVERFLTAAGRQDVDAMAVMFAPGSSIARAEFRQGHWITESQSFEAWLAALRAAHQSLWKSRAQAAMKKLRVQGLTQAAAYTDQSGDCRAARVSHQPYRTSAPK